MEYKHTPPKLLTGKEPITYGGEATGFTVLDFWSFQHSNLWDVQEEVAEFIVAKALGMKRPYNKNGWTLWDINFKGKRIEVKETGYFHSWRADGKVSEVRTFSIDKAYSEYKNHNSSYERQNDVYVFCLNTGITKEESNPLELDHWRFWVVPTSIINRLCGDNKHITLSRLKKITEQPDGIGYSELRKAINAAIMDKQ